MELEQTWLLSLRAAAGAATKTRERTTENENKTKIKQKKKSSPKLSYVELKELYSKSTFLKGN